MSLKKYMCIDLLMLCAIGIILEAVGTFFVNYMYVGAYPTTVVSLLITLLATIRWGWKGLIVIPVCALGNLIGGQFFVFRHENIGYYNWKEFLSCLIGLSTLALNLIPFHRYKTNELLQNKKWVLPVMILVNVLIYELVRGIVYGYIVHGDNGYILSNAIGFDVTGFVITLVMGLLLNRQKIMLNFKEKLEADKIRAEEDRIAEAEYLKNAGKEETKIDEQ
ncbi:MAG: hypothetical protein K2H06_01070 [Anaeroplasmataceae bacterium]|nr:hypothetical protein [Anaeroplasmataceae bacterium]